MDWGATVHGVSKSRALLRRRVRRRKWQPSPVSLPEKSHGMRSLAGNSPWGCQIVGHSLATKQQKKNKTGVYIYKTI